MSKHFLLDENVLVWPIAAQGKTAGSVKAAQLWVEIAKNCHRVLLSDELARKYEQHLQRLRSQLANFRPIPNFGAVVLQVILGKSDWVANLTCPEEQYIRHINDRFLARIAVQRPGCIVVSLEGSCQTQEDFGRREFVQLGIRAPDLDEAVQLAKLRDP